MSPLDHKVKQTGFYYHEYRITPTLLSKATTKLKNHRKLNKQESQAVLNKLERMQNGTTEPKINADLNPVLPNRLGTPIIVGCYSIYEDDVYFNDKRIDHKPSTKPMRVLKYLLKSPNRTATRDELATDLQCRDNLKIVNRNINHLKNYLKPFYDGKRTSIQKISEKPLTYRLRLPEEPEEDEST